MSKLTDGLPIEMSDFKCQLNGLLAILQKLPCGEQQVALDLLQSTINHQLNGAQHIKNNASESLSQEQCLQENHQCLHQKIRNTEIHCDMQPHASNETTVQASLHEVPNKKSLPMSQYQSLHQETKQNGHIKHLLQEKSSLNIIPHTSDSVLLNKKHKAIEADRNILVLHKTLESQKAQDSQQHTIETKIFNKSQEHTVDLQTSKGSKQTVLSIKETQCPQNILDFRSVTDPQENTSFFKTLNEDQSQVIDEETVYGTQQNTDCEGNTADCLQQTSDLEHSYKMLPVSSLEKMHTSQNKTVPLLSQDETHQLSSGNSELDDTGQQVQEFATILRPHDQNRKLYALQEPNSPKDFQSECSLISDESHSRISDVKQERSGGKQSLGNRCVTFDDTSSSNSFNVPNFSNIHDKDSLYPEETAYIFPYLERDNSEKIYFKIQNVSARKPQDNFENAPAISYSNDNFLECNAESKDPWNDLQSDKNPVDLSNASSVYNSGKIRKAENLDPSYVSYVQTSKMKARACKNVLNESGNMVNKTNEKTNNSEAKVIRKKKCLTGFPGEIRRQRKARKVKSVSVIKETVKCLSQDGNCVPSSDNDALQVDLKTDKIGCDIVYEQISHDTVKKSEVHISMMKQHPATLLTSQNFSKSLTHGVDSLDKKHADECGDSCKSGQITLTSIQDTVRLTETNQEDQGKEVSSPNLLPVCCRSCKRELPDVSLLSVHRRQCEGHFSCTFCEAKFVHKVTFSRHMEGHKKNVCSKCHQSFCSHKKLKAHMKLEHNFDLVSNTYPCHMCSRTFLKRSSLYYHLKIHATSNEHVCQKCGVFCKGNESYSLHMAEHFKATSFHCHICTACFRRRQQYDDHLKYHKKNNCEICGQPFTTKRALIRHCRIEHKTLPQNVTIDRKYKCEKCDRIFNRPSMLRHHLQLHGGVKPLECRLCNKQFSHRRSLRKHMSSTIHEHMLLTNNLQKDHAYDLKQNFAFVCEYCGIKLPTRHMLSKHSRLAHEVGIIWSCPHCEYKTKRNHALKRHMELHLESRNFMCEVCGSSFHTLATLKDHHSFVHSDERNFKCSQCNKSFKNKSSLARHSRTHSDDRPYQCHCGASYKRLSHLKRHIFSAHNEILKSRAVKKFMRTEETKNNTEQSFDRQDPTRPTEFSDGEEFEFVSVSNSSLSPVIQTETSVKSASDVLLPAQESIILMGESSNSEQGHLIAVADSQIIQLIPSTFQFPQENTFQAVSLVSASELHTLPLSAAAPYGPVAQNNQVVVEPFSLNQNSDTMVMVPASQDDHTHIGETDTIRTTFRTLETEALTDSSHIERDKRGGKQGISLHALESHTDLSVTPSLGTFDYSAPASSQALLPTLPPPHYITHAHNSNAQINQDLLQPNLICSDFILPVDGAR